MDGRTATRRVLVVDEAEFVDRNYRRALRGEGETLVFQASGCAEALALLDNGPVDVLVVDFEAAGPGALSLVEQVRSRDEHAHTQVIVTTARRDLGLVRDALARGAHACARKPLTADQIGDLVCEALACAESRGVR